MRVRPSDRKKDKHENIRLGFLSLTFHVVLTDPYMSDRPLILGMLAYGSETDSDGVWAAEVMVSYRKAEIRGSMTETETATESPLISGLVALWTREEMRTW